MSDSLGCDIYGKAEFQNPGGSVKDRAALFVVKDAEERGAYTFRCCMLMLTVLSGLIKPGGTIVEGTAGNTGIGM